MASTQKWNPRQDMLTENFEIYRYRDVYLKEVALHHHDFYEVYFFISGNVSYTIESRSYNLIPGDILLISPKELHQPTISRNSTYERIVLWINVDYLKSLSTSNSDLTKCFDADSKNRTNLLRLDTEDLNSIRMLLMELIKEISVESEYSDILVHALLQKISVELNRYFLSNASTGENVSNFNGVMADIVEYINQNHTIPISLDSLSEKFFISKYHMSREFMRHYGITIHRYIRKRRLVTAKQLMSDGLIPSAVYTKCGFADYANFYRAFKAEYGITPKEFKEYADSSKLKSGNTL